MSKKSALLLALVLLTVYSSDAMTSDLGYKPGELIVRFAPKYNGSQRNLAERNAALQSFGGGQVIHSYKLVPGLSVVKLPPSISVADVVAKFKKEKGILYAEPNYRIKLLSTFPNDPNFAQLWAMHNAGQLHPTDYGGTSSGTHDADIDAPAAWDIATNSNIIVAVIDTGIDYNHPDLAANMWVNEAELNGEPTLDDDGNGYIDDIWVWNF